MSNLTDSIKELYENISAEEAKSAADNLLSFFKLLEQIDSRLAKTTQPNERENENI